MDGVYEVKKINPSCFDKTTEEILSNLEKTKNSFWNLDRECANFLNTLIKIKNAKNVLEIGTSNGYSGIWILEALKETKGKLTTVEYWEKRQSVARANFSKCVPEVYAESKIGAAVIVLEDMLDEIKQNDFILTPGRYVGFKPEEDDGIPFEEKMEKLTKELDELFKESNELEEKIRKNLKAIGFEF